MKLAPVPDPLSPEFASTEEPRRVNTQTWLKAGAWRYRQFGNEMQLRCDALPHLPFDLWRAEAEGLYEVLADMLSKPAPLPYRLPWWTRLAQWWDRSVWRRKHHQMMERARAELIDTFIRRGPW